MSTSDSNLISPFYFCCHCRTEHNSLDSFIFVDESNKYFCSESCVEKFYQPVVKKINSLSKQIRKKYGVENESLEYLDSSGEIIHRCLQSADEVWKWDFGEESTYHILIKEDKCDGPLYVILVCLVLEGRVSFIFKSILTRKEKVRDEFKIGIRAEMEAYSKDDEPGEKRVTLDSKRIEELESLIAQKKSSELANLLEKRSDEDISYEDFMEYDEFLEALLQDPDEVFQYTDEDKDNILIYMKVFNKDNISFYYITVCYLVSAGKKEKEEDVLIPIVSFPTKDPDLYMLYQKGRKVTGQLKN